MKETAKPAGDAISQPCPIAASWLGRPSGGRAICEPTIAAMRAWFPKATGPEWRHGKLRLRLSAPPGEPVSG